MAETCAKSMCVGSLRVHRTHAQSEPVYDCLLARLDIPAGL